MVVGIPTEITSNETRVAAIPATVKELVKKGFVVNVQAGAGEGSFISDNDYIESGARIISNASELYVSSELVLKVNPPEMNNQEGKHEVDLMKSGSAFISFIQTTKDLDEVKKLQNNKITAFSMHLVPRTTMAQKMDALSSQSNIAGYKSVLIGASHIAKYMPLLMTAAGTIKPSKTLVIGAGVAGLQAIATAKRLGAQVSAFDVRPVVKEQVESLGAKFVEVASDSDDGVGEGGYAKETSDEYKQKQAELLKEHIGNSDLVITTALIPGRPAPKIITKEMVDGMKGGTAIMDLASENGGNCEYTEPGKVIDHNGITIDGSFNIPGTMSIHASQVYAKNISALVTYLCPEGELKLDMDDEIVSGALFTHNGEITDARTKEALGGVA
jgi:NAD(P) transhydrogenase subunit alpha